ncbi:unnamed protein product [Meloidogyne enterolobii]|uniref:Uncharacterized protein n=1 Tax=Meloidogyne enterolobii TaxID=390850 RepID=A0ACB0XS61_MELEN
MNMQNGRESNNNNRSNPQTNVNVNQQDHSNRANNQENHFRGTDTRRPNRARNIPIGDDARVPIREEDYPRTVPVQDNTINKMIHSVFLSWEKKIIEIFLSKKLIIKFLLQLISLLQALNVEDIHHLLLEHSIFEACNQALEKHIY